MRRSRHFPRILLAALVAGAALALASCGGGGGPSVRAETDTSTTSSSTTSTTAAGPTTTTSLPPTTTTLAGQGRLVTFGGISLRVPTSWPVHDTATDPTVCVRFNVHAVYLGQQGPNAKCPARVVGRTEAVLMEMLDAATQLDAAVATQPSTINGLSVLVDPNPDANGALTVVFPAQNVVVILVYSSAMPTVEQILATASAGP